MGDGVNERGLNLYSLYNPLQPSTALYSLSAFQPLQPFTAFTPPLPSTLSIKRIKIVLNIDDCRLNVIEHAHCAVRTCKFYILVR